jgi:hypothetical protein
MATQVQLRRGTTLQNNAFTGAQGEITVDTDLKTLRIHDGTTAGGGATVVTLAGSQSLTNKTLGSGSTWTGNAVGLAYGGTGSSLSAVQGAVAYSGASGLALTSAGTAGQVLVSGGTGSPTWTTSGSSGQFLQSNGSGSTPTWATPTVYASTGKAIAMAMVFGG